MAGEKKSGFGLPVFMLVALTTFGVFWEKVPLDVSRPRAEEGLPVLASEFAVVRAHLWEDPFAALERQRADPEAAADLLPIFLRLPPRGRWISQEPASMHLGGDDSIGLVEGNAALEQDQKPSSPLQARARASLAKGNTLVQLVLLKAGESAEDSEERKRTRYSVLAALADDEFVPKSTAHLGLMRLVVEGEEGKRSRDADVLFERFERNRAAMHRPGAPLQTVLVLWVPDDLLGPNSLMGLHGLLESFDAQFVVPTTSEVHYAIIGPTGSDGLASLLVEDADSERPACQNCIFERTKMLSPWATMSLTELRQNVEDELDEDNDWDVLGRLVEQSSARSEGAASPVGRLRALWAGAGELLAMSGGDSSAAIPGAKDAPIGRLLSLECGLDIYREVGEDEALIEAIVRELDLRGFDMVNDRLALITEWDTSYGRNFHATLVRTMAATIKSRTEGHGHDEEAAAEFDKDHEPWTLEHVHNVSRYLYMRGLDGRLAGAQDDEGAGGDPEAPFGRSQADYLRRLQSRMADQPYEYKAVVIVGTDVYDKLLILRALRPQFPAAMFFTTDLDARLLIKEEYKHTHNLLIASHRGLDPNVPSKIISKENQSYYKHVDQASVTPPFRDSYQTTTFLATKRALLIAEGHRGLLPLAPNLPNAPADGFEVEAKAPGGEGKKEEVVDRLQMGAEGFDSSVHMYEVGRTGAYRLNKGTDRINGKGWILFALPALWFLFAWARGTRPPRRKAGETRGEAFRQWLHRSGKLLGFTFGPLACGLTYLYFEGARGNTGLWRALRMDPLGPLELLVACVAPLGFGFGLAKIHKVVQLRLSQRSDDSLQLQRVVRTFRASLPALFFAYLASLALICFDLSQAGGEPATLLEGISVWPAIALRLFVVAFCLGALHFVRHLLEADEKSIQARFQLPDFDESSSPPSWQRALRPSELLRRMVSNQTGEVVEAPAGASAQGTAVNFEWRWYRKDACDRPARAIHYAIFATVVIFIVFFQEEISAGQARGRLAWWANLLTWVASMASVTLLLLFVLDATFTCSRFLRKMVNEDAPLIWSSLSRDILGRRRERRAPDTDAEFGYLDGLLDVRLAAVLSERIGQVIWFPFFGLAVLILSQNHYFDDWSLSLPTASLFSISVLGALASAVWLRRSAERVRSRVVDRLRDQLLGDKIKERAARVDEVEHALSEVQGMRRGAFLPFAQHPIVGALLLPFGGVGTLALFERMIV